MTARTESQTPLASAMWSFNFDLPPAGRSLYCTVSIASAWKSDLTRTLQDPFPRAAIETVQNQADDLGRSKLKYHMAEASGVH